MDQDKDTIKANSGYVNVPSAGSPTETLLRLLLPLNDQVWSSSANKRKMANCSLLLLGSK